MKRYLTTVAAIILVLLVCTMIPCTAQETEVPPEVTEDTEPIEQTEDPKADEQIGNLIEAAASGDVNELDRLTVELELSGILTREEITAVIRQVQTVIGERYGETVWYRQVSDFIDQYIGYIVSAVLLLTFLIVLLVINKTGIRWGKGKIKWLREKLVPWLTEKSESADQLIQAAEKWREQAEKARADAETAEADKQIVEQKLIDLETVRAGELERLAQKDQNLTRAMTLMATELSFLADTFGLNNKAAEQTKAKYTAMMELIEKSMEAGT